MGRTARSITSSTTASVRRSAPASRRPCRRCSARCRRRPMRLKSCAGASGTRAVGIAVAHDEQRQLGPGEPLLDHEGAAGVAERLAREVGAHRVARVGERLGDDARPCPRRGRRSSPRRAARTPRGTRAARSSSSAPNAAWRAVGTPASASTSFIHAFEPSSRAPAAPGPNARRPRARDRVGDARDERALGTDDDEVDVEVVGELRHRGGVGRVDGEARARSRRCPGCRARRTPRAPTATRCNAHDQRVLAPARADDEDPHAQAARGSTTVCARSGPTPTKLIGHADDVLDEAQVVARLGGEVVDLARSVSMSHCHPGNVS